VPADELSQLKGHADVVVRCDVSPATGIERNLGWLYALCRGDWIFRIDNDESASMSLLDILPNLMQADDVVQYIFPSRWLFPDSHHFLDEEPWSLDRHIRLVRNVPALIRFQGLQHTEIDLVLPHRYVDTPFYHLDCIASAMEYRIDKASRYESYRPGVRTEQGHPVNNFYLPERFQTKPTRSVPEEDRPLVDDVFRAGSQASNLAPGERRWTGQPVSHARQDEVDRFWAYREVPESAYRATWLLRPDVSQMQTDELRSVFVVVRNDGSERWPWGEDRPQIQLATRWLTADGTAMRFNSIRTPFTADVHPGTIVRQPMTLQAPPEPGEYLLELDLVHEHVRWFGCGIHLPVTVHRKSA